MASRLIIPFDNNPASISVKTASYTVPSGKYAKVHYNLEGSASISIDGVTAVRGTQASQLGSSQMVGYNGGGTGGADNFVLSASQPLSTAASAGLAFTSVTGQVTVVGDIFAPSGTVITGAGTWRAVVMEYNSIS